MKQKKSFYFDHDYNARNDQKVLQLRAEFSQKGYGLYWCFLETMAEDSRGSIDREAIGGLSIGYGMPKEKVLDILEFCVKIRLFEKDAAGNYFSPRMLIHKATMKSFADFGAKGAKKRWGDREANSPSNSPSNADYIKKIKEIPPIVPHGGTAPTLPGIPPDEEKIEPDPTGLFDLFWEMYPRKVGKGAARKAWKKIKEPGLTLEKIEDALAWQKTSEQWSKNLGEYIPHPATYLNREQWLDEPARAPAPPRAQPMYSTGPK